MLMTLAHFGAWILTSSAEADGDLLRRTGPSLPGERQLDGSPACAKAETGHDDPTDSRPPVAEVTHQQRHHDENGQSSRAARWCQARLDVQPGQISRG